MYVREYNLGVNTIHPAEPLSRSPFRLLLTRGIKRQNVGFKSVPFMS